jgi:hypothetical protein
MVVRDRCLVEHGRTIIQLDEGAVQAVRGCGWRSSVFGTQKTGENADLHAWEADLS